MAPGRSTVAREGSVSSGSGRGNTLGTDRHACEANLPNTLVPGDDEGLDAAVGCKQEIAELAGVTVSAAKMRVARAHAALRQTLDPDFGDVTSAGSRSS